MKCYNYVNGKENKTLKKLLAEKDLEMRLKDEALNKKYAWARKNS